MRRKLVGLLLTFALVFSMSVLVQAAEEQPNEPALKQYHLDMLQAAFDSITPDSVALGDNSRMEISPMDILDCGNLMFTFMEELLSPVRAVINNIVQDIVSSDYFSSRASSQIVIPSNISHYFLENVSVTIDSNGCFIFTTINYGFCIINFEKFAAQIFTFSDDVSNTVIVSESYDATNNLAILNPDDAVAIIPFSPYNRVTGGITDVFDPWTHHHIAGVSSMVRYLRHASGAISIQVGSHGPGWRIFDPRAVHRITVMHNSITSNHTANAWAATAFRIYVYVPAGGTGPMVRDVQMRSFGW